MLKKELALKKCPPIVLDLHENEIDTVNNVDCIDEKFENDVEVAPLETTQSTINVENNFLCNFDIDILNFRLENWKKYFNELELLFLKNLFPKYLFSKFNPRSFNKSIKRNTYVLKVSQLNQVINTCIDNHIMITTSLTEYQFNLLSLKGYYITQGYLIDKIKKRLKRTKFTVSQCNQILYANLRLGTKELEFFLKDLVSKNILMSQEDDKNKAEKLYNQLNI